MNKVPRNAIFLTDYTDFGGVEKVTKNLIEVLKTDDFEINTIISLQEKADRPFFLFDNITIDVMLKKGVSKNQIKSRLNAYFLENTFHNLIIQIQDLDLALQVCKIANQHKINIICVLHSSPLLYMKLYTPGGNPLKQLLRRIRVKLYRYYKSKRVFEAIIENSNKFVCISEKAYSELLKYVAPAERDKIIMIYNPIKFNVSEGHIQDVYKEKEDVLIYAGRLDALKQVLEVVKVWKKIERFYPAWKFLILGDGPQRKEIEEYVRRNSLSNVKLVGTVKNVDSYLSRSKICILFSLTEGLPTILLEACVHYNALIGNDGFGGIADIIDHGENGFLIQNSDKDELERVIKVLLSDKKKLESMGRKSLCQLHKFGQDQILDSWRSILLK